ncbi:hypothetical protein Scep_014563 [Stephania cephalantha]|uniref:Uncharacterized protein n=1 Tax=Stephania cephalantha TaxID=152367 RepID=A0AAP0J3K1_9MAGN
MGSQEHCNYIQGKKSWRNYQKFYNAHIQNVYQQLSLTTRTFKMSINHYGVLMITDNHDKIKRWMNNYLLHLQSK